MSPGNNTGIVAPLQPVGTPPWMVDLYEWIADNGTAIVMGPTYGLYYDMNAALSDAQNQLVLSGFNTTLTRVLVRPFNLPYKGCIYPGLMWIGNNYVPHQ